MDNINKENQQTPVTPPSPEEMGNLQGSNIFSQGKYPQPPEWTKNIVISQTPWPVPDEAGNLSVLFNEPEKQQPKAQKEEEYEAEEEKETQTDYNNPEQEPREKKQWPMWMQIAVVVIAGIVVLMMANKINKLVKDGETEVTTAVSTGVSIYVENTAVPTTVPTTVLTPTKEDKTTTLKGKNESTTQKAEKPSDKNEEPAPTTVSVADGNEEKIKKQIIEYFNESSNRVKTEAVKVVKNFENRSHDADKLFLPAAIKGVGKSLLESRITNVTEPVEYAVSEAIVARYPVPGAKYSSILTADEVYQAVCEDKGEEYEITLVLNKCVDPEPGKGTSKAMDCLDVPTVRDTAPPFITSFSAEYYDCVIRCRVEKATGRVVWSNYTTPVLIKVGLDAGFTQFDAHIGLTFEKDYTITY